MEPVYISHQLSGNWRKNIKAARLFVRAALLAGYAPVAPYLMDYDVLNEPQDRELGLAHDLALVPLCKELWLCGPIISPGMADEHDKAKETDIRIRRFFTPEEVYHD